MTGIETSPTDRFIATNIISTDLSAVSTKKLFSCSPVCLAHGVLCSQKAPQARLCPNLERRNTQKKRCDVGSSASPAFTFCCTSATPAATEALLRLCASSRKKKTPNKKTAAHFKGRVQVKGKKKRHQSGGSLEEARSLGPSASAAGGREIDARLQASSSVAAPRRAGACGRI